MYIYPRIKDLEKKHINTSFGRRAIAQLSYAYRVSLYSVNDYNTIFIKAIEFIEKNAVSFINEDICNEIEAILSPMAKECKAYKMHCASHSHIDMNFLWGYNETVSVIINTFKTMLDLLDEYETFIYSQASAAAYEVIEKYAPEMLLQIKKYIDQGRWEVMASSWVEADKNMPSVESLLRQTIYAKNYISNLFHINENSLKVGFEPDTFGHNKNLPEILQEVGIEYYYFCRGLNNINNIFLWEADSGRNVIAYKEPHWYFTVIDWDSVITVPEFCNTNKVDTMLRVYGVGDHGGGPTRRDLERIIEMSQWPIFPQIHFGTYHDYFKTIEKNKANFPVVRNELNPIFTGCYTSQSKIKNANKKAESLLFEAELWNGLSVSFAQDINRELLIKECWKKALFNQFHDILPGSCTNSVKEYALGEYQKVFAGANTVRALSLEKIADRIDTTCFIEYWNEEKDGFSKGAGAGVFVEKYNLTGITEKGTGLSRVFHIFNSTQYDQEEVTEVLLWDYNADIDSLQILDSNNNEIPFDLVEKEFNEHWGHYYIRIFVLCKVKAFGYNSYIITQNSNLKIDETNKMAIDYPYVLENLPPNEAYNDYVLENENLKAVFDYKTFHIKSLVDKKTNFEHCKEPTGIFKYILEDVSVGANAWIIGRYAKVSSIETFRLIKSYQSSQAQRQYLDLSCVFGNSTMEIRISLDKCADKLVYTIVCNSKEIGDNKYIPQLSFCYDVAYETSDYIYDTSGGLIKRRDYSNDCCANNFVMASNNSGSSIMISSATNYGYRCQNNSISLTILRGSQSPDPYPEVGERVFSFAIGIVSSELHAYKMALSMRYPMICISGTIKKGVLPAYGGFIETCADVIITSISFKAATNKFNIRYFEPLGLNPQLLVNINYHMVNSSNAIGFNRVDKKQVASYSLGNIEI